MKSFYSLSALCLALLVSTKPAHAVTFTISPNTVSNTFPGYVTLQITGLSSGDTVLVQKYADLNTNGVIDGGDLLVQQFQLTDAQPGMVIGGVVNTNVPGDTDAIAGQITTPLNFQNGDISQIIVAPYAYRLSSPAGHFSPITNFFTVTNFAYSQSFTGLVVNAGTNVPNAVVLLFSPPSNNSGNKPLAGTVANNSGAYSIKAAAGTYTLLAFKTNYLFNQATSPLLTLTNGQTITTNLTLTNITQTISGKIVDSTNSSLGLPGLLVPVQSSTNNWLTVGFTDTNGNFTVGTQPDQWKFSNNSEAVAVYGYLTSQNKKKVDTSTGSVAGVTISYPRATAFFYGTLTDNLNNPVQGVVMNSSDNGQYSSSAVTDQNGYYALGALCGTNWQVMVSSDENPSYTNYDFSQSSIDQNGGTNFTCGQVAQVNFSVELATNHITGWVKDDSGNPLTNVQVTAFSGATLSGFVYQVQGLTDASGNYSLNVANGNWTVNICCGCNGCGNGCLPSNYQCPGPQNLLNVTNNVILNFTVPLCPPLSIASPSPLPGAGLNVPYAFQFTNNGCNGPFNWSACSPLPAGLNVDSNGNLSGMPTVLGSNYFCVQVMDSTSATTNAYFTLIVNRLTITTPSLFNGAVGAGYTNQLTADFGQPPYTWALNSGTLPGGIGFSSAGVLNGVPTVSGTFNFNVGVTDANSSSTNKSFSLLINPKSSAPPFRWAVKAGGSAEDQAFGLGVDAAGNAYLAGHFYSSTATFGNITLANKGSADAFLAKFNNAGNIVWAKGFGAEGDDEALGLATDTSGNSYVCGWFSSTNIDLGTGPLANAAPGTNDVFIAKYNSNGSVIWARSAGGAGDDSGIRIAADTNGNCYVVGYFASPTITFGLFTLTNVTTDGSWDMFLVKFDTIGNVLWAKSAGGSGFDIGNSVAVDSAGNVFVTGQFDGTNINLSGTVLTNLGNPGTTDIFLAKYSSAGALQWVRQAGGNDSEAAFLAADAAGNTYLTGLFISSILNFSGAGTGLTNSALDGSESFFLAKYNSAGTLQWARSAVGDSYDDGRGIAVDAAGNSYVAGFFGSDSISFGNVTLMDYASAGGPADVFVVKYDSSGNVLWAKRAGGSKADQARNLALDPAGNLYVTGHFKSSNAQFDSTTLATSGNWDVFLALIDGSSPTLSIKLSGAQALLQWPTNRPGYQLESESALTNPPGWSAVTNPVGIVGNQNTVTNNLSSAKTKFYRLRSQ